MKKLALAIMASAAMVLGFGVVANAYPPGAGSVTAAPAAPAAGEPITVTATCEPAETVTFTFEGATNAETCGAAGTATASLFSLASAGSASTTFNAPAAAGTYTGLATGSSTGVLGTFTVTVADSGTDEALPSTDSTATGSTATGPTTNAGLPATGSDTTRTMTIIALGLFAVGAGLFGVSQLRRRTAA